MIRVLFLLALAVALSGSVTAWIEHSRHLPLFCQASGCASVLSGPYAVWLGIPVAAVGVIAFVALLAFAGHWIAPQRKQFFGIDRGRLVTVFALLATAVAIALILMQQFVIGQICKLCMMVDLSTVAAGMLSLHLPQQSSELNEVGSGLALEAQRLEAQRLHTQPSNTQRHGRWISLVFGLLGVAIPVGIAISRPGPRPPSVITDAPQGSIVVVVNSSFVCPGCRLTHPTIESAIEDVASTNPSFTVYRRLIVFPEHNDTAAHHRAAKAFLAAEALGKGPAMRKLLYSHKDFASASADDQLIRHATSIGITPQAYATELQSDKHDDTIRQHLSEFNQSNVPGIPAVWVGERLFYGPAAMSDAAAYLRDVGQRQE